MPTLTKPRKPKARDALTRKWTRSAQDEAAVAEGCRFDLDAAVHVEQFFARFLRHSKGEWAGQPFTLMTWQRDEVIYPLFGWKRLDGTRRYRRGNFWIAKKNGKSSMLSAIGVYMLVADGEGGAECYSAAVDRDQASIVHGEAINMVRASQDLSRRLDVNMTTKRIAYTEKNSWYGALASDADSAEGKNIHFLGIDELHAWKNKRAFFDTLRYGGAARRQPLTVTISTAGIYDATSVGWEEYEYAKKLIEGSVIDTSTLAVVYEADKEADWTQEPAWKAANPSYGVTVKPDEMREMCREAQEKPRLENTFRRYRLGQWVEQTERWLSMEKWNACGGAFDVASLDGRPCWGGIDLGDTTDMTVLCLAFPEPEESYKLLWWFWVPEEIATVRERRYRASYVTWARQGCVTMTPGASMDYGYIRRTVGELAKKYKVQEIAYDPWNAKQICENELFNTDGLPMVMHRQGYGELSEPSKYFEQAVIKGSIRHGDNPVAKWQAGNVAVDSDAAGNIKPSKKTSGEKIDGIVAAIMAVGRARGQQGGANVYDYTKPGKGISWI